MYSEKLNNGLSAKITDHSRQVAGDRWYINLVCTVTLPVDKELFKNKAEDDPGLFARITDHIGEEIRKDFVLERNFVDDSEKDDVVDDLFARLKDNIKTYLAVEKFPARLFDESYDKARTICLTMTERPQDGSPVDEDGPADFSACFND